ncbi:MAG: gliding motility-associated C-terminal domain-containing protein [Flavobacteriales bacterium]|nr:gliding motility-associated C-terminal domain-containing protein [Flavobacteriales bacterium]
MYKILEFMHFSPSKSIGRIIGRPELLVAFFIFILSTTISFAQTSTEFWLAPPQVTSGHSTGGDPSYIRLASGDLAADVTISQPANPGFNGGTPITTTLAPNSSETIEITSLLPDLFTSPTGTVLNTGLKIESTTDITAIFEISSPQNPDIWALKGINGLGTEFYTPMQNTWRNGSYTPEPYTSFDIVATEDNTTVLIYPTSELDGGQPAFESFVITLNEGQTYSASVTSTNGSDNPSGSSIISDKPIAVSVKDDSVWPQPAGCKDLIGDQLVPVDIVGNEYIVNKGGLTTPEYAYVVATQTNTQISVNGAVETTLFNGETYRITITDDLTYITGDKDFYLIHISGFGCEVGMALLPPLNCAGSEQVSFVRATNESFFINLLVPAGAEDDFVLNGDATLIDPADFDPVPGTGGFWVGAQIQFGTGQIPSGDPNLITNSQEPFSLGLINGGASSGCRFGYFSEFSAEILVDAGPDQTVCANRDTEIEGSISGGATQGVWSTNGTGTFVPDATTLEATYEPSLADLSAGEVTLTLTSVSNCFPVEDEVVITYTPAPVVNAGADIEACENNTTVTLDGFVDVATGGVWGGGDGTFNPSPGTLDATYTPSAAEVADGSVELTLSSTGNGNCLQESDVVEITFGPAPTADAGEDQVLCENNPDAQLNGSVTIAGGGVWSGGTGFFTPSASSLAPIYTPSNLELLNGSVTLTLTTTDNAGCNPATDEVTLTFTDAPTADAGSDQTVCRNNADVTLNGSVAVASGGTWTGGNGTFSPDENTLNAVYTPTFNELLTGNVTLTLTTTGNGDCVPESDEMTINFTDAPTVDAGADADICENNPDIDLNGSLTGASFGIWSGGGGTFSPSTTELDATYTPTAGEISSGSITLTLTSLDNGNCNPEEDEVTFTFTPAPTADAGADQDICENNPAVDLSGSISVAGGGQWSGGSGSFSPDNTALNATYNPTAAEISNGSVTLTLTTTANGNCTPVSDAVTINFTDAPTASAGSNQTICANNSEVSLDGSVSIASGGTWSGGLGTYTPNNDDLEATYSPTASEISSGSLTLTLTTTGNGNCIAVTDDVVLTFTEAPDVDAGSNISVCSNNAQVDLDGSVSNAGGGTWSGGAGTFVPNANSLNATYNPTAGEIASGSMSLVLTSTSNGNCNPEQDVVNINFTPSPSVSAGSDPTVCANDPEVNLNGSISIATGGVWSGGSGTFSPDNASLGATYTPSLAEISAGTATLTLTSTGNGDCNSESDQVTITITPEPTVDAGTGSELCSNNAEISLNGSVTIATGAAWSGGSGSFSPDASTLNATYVPSQSEINNGSVTLTLASTGNNNCIAVSDDVTYTFGPAPTADAGADQTVCSNNADVSLSGSVTVATGGTWSGGAGTFAPGANDLNATYTPTATEIADGSVTLTLTTTGNGSCLPETDEVEITFGPSPVVDAGTDQTVCANNADVSLDGSVSVATGGTWSGGLGTFSPNANELDATYTPSPAEITAGTVTLTLTSTGNGDCLPESDQVEITITPPPTANAGTDAEFCSNNAEISLNGSVTIASGGLWSGGNGTFDPDDATLNANYTPTQTEINNGSVTLTLSTTGNGNCTPATDDVTFTFGPAPEVNAGVDQTLCANNAEATLSGSVNVATGGTWSGGSGTYSPGAGDLNAVYTPTPAEISSGSVTLTLTSTGNGNCVSETDEVTLNFTPAPTANPGSDQTVCGNDAEVDLNGQVTVASGGTWTGGDGVFSPDNNTLNATYTPSADEISDGGVTLTLTTTGNATCLPVSNDLEITITPAPEVDAGTGSELCSNNPEINLNGSVTVASGGSWSGGSGTFSPNSNDLNATYVPSQSEINNGVVNASYTPTQTEIDNGGVTLTLSTTGNGNCLPVTDEIVLTFTPAPTANPGADQTVCANDAEVDLDGNVSVATGGTWTGGNGIFSPDNNTLDATYEPSADEIAAGEVTLTLTTTGNANCLPESNDITITITPAPVVDAGTGTELCSNNPEISLNGSVTIASGGAWSGGNGTFNPNSTTLNATYVPSQTEINNGEVTLTLTSTGNGSCVAETDDVTYTFGPSPTADAGENSSVCSNNADVLLDGAVTIATGGTWSGGNGTFTPDENTLNATYTPTADEIDDGSLTLTLTTTGNGNCIPVTDDVEITFTPSPVANAGNDRTVCANNAEVNLNGAVSVASGGTWSGGNGVFSPDANALDAAYTPSTDEIAEGTVTLTLTTTGNGNCIPVTDQMTITITPEPVVDAGTGSEFCANNPEIELNGSVTGATGGSWSGASGSFTPNSNALDATYTPSQSEINGGVLTLTLTSTGNGNCVAVSDDVTYTFGTAPTADAGANQTLCANNAEVSLEGEVTVATGGTWSGGDGVFSPNANALNASYLPTADEIDSGSLTLTLTTTGNGNCLPETDEVTINFTPAPTANAGSDIDVCENDVEANLNGSVSTASGGVWSGGNGVFSPDANSLGATYTPTTAEISNGGVVLTLTTTGIGNCLPVSDNVQINIAPAPVVSAGADQNICENNADVQLDGNVSNAGGGVWSGGLGTYSSSANDVNAVYTPTFPEIVSGSVTLTLTSTDNESCVAESDEMTITFTPAPTVDAGDDITLCAASPQATLDGSFTVAGGAQWSGGAGSYSPNSLNMSAVYSPTAAEIADGSVTLTLTSIANGNCLEESDEVTIFFDPIPTVNAGSNLSSCQNAPTVSLNGSFTNADGVEWNGGNGFFDPGDEDPQANYTPSNAEITNGFVTLTLTTDGTGECPEVSDDVNITINPSPDVDAGDNVEVCANNSDVSLNGSVALAGGGVWSGGTGTFIPSNTTLNATYQPSADDISNGFVNLTLTSTSNGNCNSESDQMTINFTPAPIVDAGTDITACENNATVTLNGSFTVSEGANWSGGSGSFSPDASTVNATYSPSQSELAAGTVTLTLTTFGNGNCTPVSDQVTLNFTPAPEVDAGEDYFACVDDLVVPLDGEVTGPTSTGIWSTSGSGVFVPTAGVLDGSYQISSADSLNGEVTLTLTSTNNGNCTPVSEEITVFIAPAGTSDAGEDQELCSNNPVASVEGTIGGAATEGTWITSGSGAFTPNANQTNANYVPSETDIANGSVTLTFAVNSCNQATDDLIITYTPSPVVDAGEDLTVCSSEESVDIAGLVSGASNTGEWTSSGSGTFSPSPNALNTSYVWSEEDEEVQVIELILTSTDIGNCISVSDTLTLNVFPEGTANAGSDAVSCANNPEVQLSGSLTGATEAVWTTSGSGSFAPAADTLNTTYVPSEADILNGGVQIVLNATNSCNLASDFLEITIVPSPVVDAGADQSACGTISPFAISGSVENAGGGEWSTTGTGVFQNPENLSTFYVASEADIESGEVFLVLSSTDDGTCFTETDSLRLLLSNGIEVYPGTDQQACVDATQVQLFGEVSNGSTTGIWSTSGNGTFSPANTALNAVYEFTQDDIDAGSVEITLTSTDNGACPQVSESFELTFGNSAFVFAGDNSTVCEDTPQIELNGIISGETTTGIWTTSGDGSFSPGANTLNANYLPSANDIANGSVELTLTSTNSVLCNEGNDTRTITFQPLPTANAGPDQVVCSELEPLQLTGSVSGANGGFWTTSGSGFFSPNDSLATAFYTPSEADSIIGSVTLTLTTFGNGTCTGDSDQMNISFTGAVTADAGDDIEICEDVESVVIIGDIDGTDEYFWSTNGSGSFDPSAEILNTAYLPTAEDIEAGSIQIYLEGTGNSECPATVDSLTLTIDRIPLIDAATAIDACVIDTEVDVSSDVDFADELLWTSLGSGTFIPDNASEDITYEPTTAEINSGQAVLTLTATSEGVCGSVQETVTVSFRSLADVDAGQDLVACETAGQIDLSGSVTGQGYTGVWSTNSFGTFDPDATELDASYFFGNNDILIGAATLVLTSADNGPCPAQADTLGITINPAPSVDAGEDDFVCETAGMVELSGEVENAASVEWSTSGDGVFLPSNDVNNPEYIIGNNDGADEGVELILTALPLEACEEVSDTVFIEISNPLDLGFSFDGTCAGVPTQFTDETEVLAGSITGWTWDFGDGNISNQQNPSFVFKEVGSTSIQLAVQNSLGCSDTITQVVTVAEPPVANFEVNTNPAPAEFDIIFDNNSTNASSYEWDFGDGQGTSEDANPTYAFAEGGDYVVTLIAEGFTGCTDAFQSTITIDGVVVLPPRLPNSFSPNDDGTNDVYYVRGGPFTELDFRVYDAWGAEIFQTNDQEQGWDGTQNGKQSPIGVYVYTVVATNTDGESFDFSGRINLLR